MTKIRKKYEEPSEWQRFLRNCRVSLIGTRDVWREERTFRQWMIVNLVSIGLLILIRPGFIASAVIVYAGLQVLVAELLNTAIEAVVDVLEKEHQPLTKLAKDAGSAAVAFAAIGLGFVWICVLWLRFL